LVKLALGKGERDGGAIRVPEINPVAERSAVGEREIDGEGDVVLDSVAVKDVDGDGMFVLVDGDGRGRVRGELDDRV
jgi:hypothetical protein